MQSAPVAGHEPTTKCQAKVLRHISWHILRCPV